MEQISDSEEFSTALAKDHADGDISMVTELVNLYPTVALMTKC